MTTYKELFGKAVKYLSTDPDNAQAEGQDLVQLVLVAHLRVWWLVKLCRLVHL
jgi:hypothetical protein